MWRPFVHGLTIHTYENFVKKTVRADSAPLGFRDSSVKGKKNKSFVEVSEEAKKRVVDFQNLKKKVKLQRESIKMQEDVKRRKEEIRIKLCKELQLEMKKRRNEEMKRVRAMSSCKPSRISPGKNVFELTCVDTCRKLKDKGGFMEQIKKINKDYMKKIQLSSSKNKENNSNLLKFKEDIKKTHLQKNFYA